MKTMFAVLALAAASVASAGTINLPDPSVYTNFANNTTLIGIAGKYYRAPSQFVYFSECAKPDGARYHCNISVENDVVAVAGDGSTVTVNVTVQFASTLIVSGHNYWRQSQILLSGDVTVQ